MAKRTICKHGGDATKYVCPDCANEAMAKRQRKLDRAEFKARIARIKGQS